MKNLIVELVQWRSGDSLAVEVVEKKGVGHPDTICDELAEAVSHALRGYYLSEFGRDFHYNVDKVLLRAGTSRAEFGAGTITAPTEVYVCGRATTHIFGKSVPVTELCETSVRSWLRSNLRYVNVERDVRIINLIRPGSEDLIQLFERDGPMKVPRSNDTSIGVGFSPLSRLEKAVLELDACLRSRVLLSKMSFIGEDIKIMAIRERDRIRMTVAYATVSRFIESLNDYIGKKAELKQRLQSHLEGAGFPGVDLFLNAADDLDAGSVYLTVSGTSAEAGDDGEVGRGNRANGLITPCRAMTTEAFAGKNPVNHTGRIYQLWAQAIAERINKEVAGMAGVECLMVSQIGAYINQPQIVNVRCRGSLKEVDFARLERVASDVVWSVCTTSSDLRRNAS